MHLTVISYPAELDWEIEPVVFQVNGSSTRESRRFVRCQRPEQLFWIVRDVVDRTGGRPLQRLDLFGHGKPGTLMLGNETIVAPDESTWEGLINLSDHLDDKAEIRLLGCETATCEEGLKVLKGLSKELSQKYGQERTVWGTTATIDWGDFGPEGFNEAVARKYLKSSKQLSTAVQGEKRLSHPGPVTAVDHQWIAAQLPPGYAPEGYMNMPAAIVDDTWPTGDLMVTISGARRIIAVKSKPGRQYLFRWLSTAPAPHLGELKKRLAPHLV